MWKGLKVVLKLEALVGAASPRPPSWANKFGYWPPKTCPRPFSDPRPAGMDFRLCGGIQRLFTFFTV
jgi:hypothetical protein